jgi:hypothetical protein
VAWYGVRNIYHFGVKTDGMNVFEERVVCIHATSFEEAHIKGKAEAESYSQENDMAAYYEQLVYKQDGEALIDGYEVWSNLYESILSLDEFYKDHYEKHRYHPE